MAGRARAAWLAAMLVAGTAADAAPVAICATVPGAPDDLCSAFLDRLQQSHPGALAGQDARATVRLVVLRAGPRRIAARIDWRQGDRWRSGPVMGAARSGGEWDRPGLTRFLDCLIARSPQP
ncbi:MAG: hypothetical protein KF887_13475 [Paracoccaceae bacterium]|nr:MAG: hypothetical protein KF887_13475 [Paracoccaceae bacterium]